jgi:cyclopropane-fatty-acyl-phospholipid synthase
MTSSPHPQIANGLDAMFQQYDGPSFALRLWDGWEWTPSRGEKPRCTIVIGTPETLATLLSSPDEITLGEAFIHRDLDIEGDIFSVFAVAEHIFSQQPSLRQRVSAQMAKALLHLQRWTKHGSPHSPRRDRSSISYHYDQPVEFYRPWLGGSLAYSCAYFHAPDDSLDAAQQRKLELICRKLRLKPFERFLDVGCGWGSLILHAASRHCAHARGITLSREQATIAQNRVESAGIASRCGVALQDYRELSDRKNAFDKIASVGMFEHVGLKGLPEYFRILRTLLRPGGVLLNHGIARAYSSPKHNRSFIDKYVFPDGELVTLEQVIRAAESQGLEVRDMENLREHYELTLRKWVAGLRQHAAEVKQFVSDEIYRIWLLYMAGSAAAFQRGDIAVYQVLLSRPDRGNSGLPLTREDWYADQLAFQGDFAFGRAPRTADLL